MTADNIGARVFETDLRKVDLHPDHWHLLARSRELNPGRIVGRQFAGEPVALFRTEPGRVIALEGRCAHRQVPLHLGEIDGEALRCSYHGWA